MSSVVFFFFLVRRSILVFLFTHAEAIEAALSPMVRPEYTWACLGRCAAVCGGGGGWGGVGGVVGSGQEW